jgi:hypothetical protein
MLVIAVKAGTHPGGGQAISHDRALNYFPSQLLFHIIRLVPLAMGAVLRQGLMLLRKRAYSGRPDAAQPKSLKEYDGERFGQTIATLKHLVGLLLFSTTGRRGLQPHTNGSASPHVSLAVACCRGTLWGLEECASVVF